MNCFQENIQFTRGIFMFLCIFATCIFNSISLTSKMTYDQFNDSLSQEAPPKQLSVLLQALWYDAKGDWESAHNIAQSSEGTPAYDHLHAYLHRVEGDTWNAGYWYRRAGVEVFNGTLKEEWKALVLALL